jgi:dihydrofolate reductase
VLATVAALSRNRVIGHQGRLPWHLPGDLKFFRETTRGGVVVMGRATYESIGRPLPHRENWVLTRQSDWQAAGVTVFRDLAELLRACQPRPAVWVIGGESLYRALLPYCARQFLTEIEAEVEGDTYYPVYAEAEWRLLEKRPGPAGEALEYHFCIYERVAGGLTLPSNP